MLLVSAEAAVKSKAFTAESVEKGREGEEKRCAPGGCTGVFSDRLRWTSLEHGICRDRDASKKPRARADGIFFGIVTVVN